MATVAEASEPQPGDEERCDAVLRTGSETDRSAQRCRQCRPFSVSQRDSKTDRGAQSECEARCFSAALREHDVVLATETHDRVAASAGDNAGRDVPRSTCG